MPNFYFESNGLVPSITICGPNGEHPKKVTADWVVGASQLISRLRDSCDEKSRSLNEDRQAIDALSQQLFQELFG